MDKYLKFLIVYFISSVIAAAFFLKWQLMLSFELAFIIFGLILILRMRGIKRRYGKDIFLIFFTLMFFSLRANAYSETIGDTSNYVNSGLYADTTYLSKWIPVQSGDVSSLAINIQATGNGIGGGCGGMPLCGNGDLRMYVYNANGEILDWTDQPIHIQQAGWNGEWFPSGGASLLHVK